MVNGIIADLEVLEEEYIPENIPCREVQKQELVFLKDYIGKKVVLYFYPKDGSPGCTKEAIEFRDMAKDFEKEDAVILGVSKDSVKSHQKFKGKHNLPFTLLSDPEGRVLDLYGVWKKKSLYGRTFMGTERTTFLIDEKGDCEKSKGKRTRTSLPSRPLEPHSIKTFRNTRANLLLSTPLARNTFSFSPTASKFHHQKPASTISGNGTMLLNNYFQKNHCYRNGRLSVPRRDLVYIDDDWAACADEDDNALKFFIECLTLIASS